MNDNSPAPSGISNLREPSFTLSTRMIAAMLGDDEPAPRLIALNNAPPKRVPMSSAFAAIAESIVDSDPVIRTFAACEWDCLDDDGKQWIIAIVRETLRRADALIPVEGGEA